MADYGCNGCGKCYDCLEMKRIQERNSTNDQLRAIIKRNLGTEDGNDDIAFLAEMVLMLRIKDKSR